MTRKPDALGKELRDLAILIVKAAKSGEVDLGTRLDVLKIIGNYHVASAKAGHSDEASSAEAETFAGFAQRIREAEGDANVVSLRKEEE